MTKKENTYKDPLMNNLEAKTKGIEKQIYIFVVIALIIIIGVVAAFLFKQNSDNFNYNNIEFNKNYLGKVVFYTAKVPIKDTSGNVINNMFIDFRNDPRKISNIELNLDGPIGFTVFKQTYVSYGDLNVCEYNGVAASNLALLLINLGINFNGTLLNKTLAQNSHIGYASCENNPDSTVIEIKNGQKNSINRINKNCYEIISKDCDLLMVMEKFELILLEQVNSV